jgi:hypothetical protein
MVRPLFGKISLTNHLRDTAGDWNNAQDGVRVPVYGILCDGDVFEFFRFDGSTKPPRSIMDVMAQLLEPVWYSQTSLTP